MKLNTRAQTFKNFTMTTPQHSNASGLPVYNSMASQKGSSKAARRGEARHSAKGVPRSHSIPVSGYIHRTPSELQLCEDEAIADYRDYCFYSRIIGGISRQQMKLQSGLELRYKNDETLFNIIRTRYATPPSPSDGDEGVDHIIHFLRETKVCEDWEPAFFELDQAFEPSQEQGVFDLEM
jgi:hypothetical protein